MSVTLIINADDLGYDPAITRGIIEAMTRGIVSSTTFMVNTPHSEDTAQKIKGTALAVGLHFNLARWAPISRVPSQLLAADSTFVEGRVAELPPDVVELEALAQLDRLEKLTGRAASHVDVHKHLHRSPKVLEGVMRAAVKRKLPVRSVDAAMRAQLRARKIATNDALLGDADSLDPQWPRDRLRTALFALPETGVVELMCHPGYTPVVTRSGYGAQREVELQSFTSQDARDWIRARNLTPTSWWSLHGA